MTRDERFLQQAAASGHAFDGEIRVGGHYVPWVRDGDTVYLSGQVPRVGDRVVVTGRAGEDVTLAQARQGATVCALRALALLQRALGSLERIRAVLRVTVYVQCSAAFTQHSEVADAASDTLHAVLGPAGVHSRTSVGVMALPKDATVELDLIAAVEPDPPS